MMMVEVALRPASRVPVRPSETAARPVPEARVLVASGPVVFLVSVVFIDASPSTRRLPARPTREYSPRTRRSTHVRRQHQYRWYGVQSIHTMTTWYLRM